MATIYYFTSTGNSLYAAKKIAEKTGGKIVPMSGSSATCEDGVIGFVFPVYFWGLPRIVSRFISGLHIEDKDAYVFSVATYGGVVRGVTGQVKNLLSQKGLALNYAANIKMVENYIPYYKVNDSEAFRQKIDADISKIAGAIACKTSNRIQAYTFINKLMYRFYPDENSDRFFSVSAACTGCAICQKACPAQNIKIVSGKPEFLHKCEHCLACAHICPVLAIDWKHKIRDRKRFRNAGVTLDEMLSFNKTEET